MKMKKLLIFSIVPLLFACGGSQTPSNDITSGTSVEEVNKFDLFKDAVTFKTNKNYTGYRLSITIKNKSTNEQVYTLSRMVSIDTVNNTSELIEDVTRINDSIDGDGDKITESTHMYYTRGSIIVKDVDGRYVEKDGIITQSTGLPTFNPSVESFNELNLNLTGNVLKMDGIINPSKANELFAAEGLEDIQNAKMTASIYDDKLEEITWNYDIDGMNINQRLVISYNAYTIVPPAL